MTTRRSTGPRSCWNGRRTRSPTVAASSSRTTTSWPSRAAGKLTRRAGQATRLQMTVRFIGGRLGPSRDPDGGRHRPGRTRRARARAGHMLRPGRLIGIAVSEPRDRWARKYRPRESTLTTALASRGRGTSRYVSNNLTQWQFPDRSRGMPHGPGSRTEDRVRAFTGLLHRTYGLVPAALPGVGGTGERRPASGRVDRPGRPADLGARRRRGRTPRPIRRTSLRRPAAHRGTQIFQPAAIITAMCSPPLSRVGPSNSRKCRLIVAERSRACSACQSMTCG